MLGNGHISKSTGVFGWHSELEERLFIELASKLQNGEIIVELGSEYGRSAAEFLFATKGKDVLVYTVDIYPNNHYLVGDLLQAQVQNLTESGVDIHRHRPIKGKSFDIGQTWRGGEIALLFIDAAHDYASVKADIEAWQNHVKVGGIIAYHDYWRNAQSHPVHIEVKRAVDEWYDKTQWERHEGVDSLIYFVKPENALIIEASTDFELPSNVTISEITGVPGWLKQSEENELIKLAIDFVPDNGTIVELGAGLGRSASAFAYACRNKQYVKIYSIDLFDEGSFSKRFPYSQLKQWYKNVFEAMDKLSIAYKHDTLNWSVSVMNRQQNTNKDDFTLYGSKIDLLFIDADHDYSSVKADIAAWVRHIRPGGIVAFHDYDLTSVAQAVDEWQSEAKWWKQTRTDSLIYFVRPFEIDELPFTDPEFEGDHVVNPITVCNSEMTLKELSDTLGYPVSTLRAKLKNIEHGSRGREYVYDLNLVQRILNG